MFWYEFQTWNLGLFPCKLSVLNICYAPKDNHLKIESLFANIGERPKVQSKKLVIYKCKCGYNIVEDIECQPKTYEIQYSDTIQ